MLHYPLRKQADGTPYPRKTWVVQIELQGDDERDIISRLRNFLFEAESGQTSWQVVGGGIIVSKDVDDSITPESYRQSLDDYMENKKKVEG